MMTARFGAAPSGPAGGVPPPFVVLVMDFLRLPPGLGGSRVWPTKAPSTNKDATGRQYATDAMPDSVESLVPRHRLK
jgi:hypothetical protein